MKNIRYIIPGVLFGIVMTKSEAVSWFRIQEMFRFESFHMYGIIGTAVSLAALMVFILKKRPLQNLDGNMISFSPKAKTYYRYLYGGIIFGLGWAMTGACPGPMFTLIGHGLLSILIVIAGAIIGTFLYGSIRSKLPH